MNVMRALIFEGRSLSFFLFVSLVTFGQSLAQAAPPMLDTGRGDRMIAEYFRTETAKLRDNCFAEIKSLDDWKAKRPEYHRQLLEMLGLDPLPERTDLKASSGSRSSTSSRLKTSISSRGPVCMSLATCTFPKR
jgi:hypothetical protein